MNGTRVTFLATALFALAAPAAAQTNPESPLAEALFREGRTLMESGRFHEACPKLAESQRLDPTIGTLINLAGCHELEGRTATAWAEFLDVATQAQQTGRTEREKTAREHAAMLEKRLHRVSLKAQARPGLEVKLDGRRLGDGALGTPFPVDPGEHVLEAELPGYKPFTHKFVAEDKQAHTKIDIVLAPIAASASPPSEPSSSSTTGWGIVVGAVGVVGLGLGTYFGVRAFDKKSEGDPYCNAGDCSQSGLDLHSEARTSATISTIAFAAGLVGVAAGTYLIFFAPRTTGRPAASVAVSFGPNGEPGLALRNSF